MADELPRPQSRMRRFAMATTAVVVVYLACELILFTVISIRFGKVFTFREFEARPREVGAGSDPLHLDNVPTRVRARKEVVHPYLGYVYDPSVEHASPFGISDVSPIQHRSPDKVIVGVFGGSFADDVAYHDEKGSLAEQLQPYFPGKNIVVVKGTIGGYKQPQQLMALGYFTALGGDFDVVINLDGFNEVALPKAENIPNTNPFFPREWHLRVRAVPDAELLGKIGEIRIIDALNLKWSALFFHAPLRYSVTANTIWRIGDQLMYKASVARRAELPQLARGGAYMEAGPPVTFASDAEMYDALAGAWEEASFEMNAIATAKGTRYFHFLQPNQYLDGTKPMGAEERGTAILANHPYGVAVKQAYPVLKKRGQELRARGVNFTDLTNVYATTSAPLYRDNCCHVNGDGRRLVIAAIARTVGASLAARK